MKKIVLLVAIGGLTSFGQPKLVRMKVTDDIIVFVPKDWIPMDDLDFTERYPSVRAPIAAFTDQNREIDFSVRISATQWPDANLEMAQKFFKASVLNMFDRVEMIGEGVHEVNGNNLVFFEFESRVHGNRRQEGFSSPVLTYTYLQYLVEPERTLVFSFNCPVRIRQEWQETAHKMMEKIKIR